MLSRAIQAAVRAIGDAEIWAGVVIIAAIAWAWNQWPWLDRFLAEFNWYGRFAAGAFFIVGVLRWLSVGQVWVERHFGRADTPPAPQPAETKATGGDR